jgi:hypothetical protein
MRLRDKVGITNHAIVKKLPSFWPIQTGKANILILQLDEGGQRVCPVERHTPCTSIFLAVNIVTPCTPILLAIERDTPCMSLLKLVERYTPCTFILLAVEMDTSCTSILQAVEMDTSCTSILLVVVVVEGIPSAHPN